MLSGLHSVADSPVTSKADVKAKTERWLRSAAILFFILAALGICLYFASAIWADNEFSQPESIVAAQSNMLVRDGYFYGTLKDYPYTVNAYMPVYYLLEAGLLKAGVPLPLGGRMISFAALIGIFFLAWRVTFCYTGSRHCAYMASLLCASTALLSQWGTIGQVDMLGVFLSLTSFYYFSRYWIAQQNTLLPAALFAAAGLLVKQTVVSAPAAIFLLLLFRAPKQAFRFAAIVGGILGTVMIAANIGTDGGFLANTVFANMNPFAWEKIQPHADYMLVFAAQLILVVAVCAQRIWNTPARALLVYLGLAASVLAITAPKIGSDSNYQIETTVLLAIAAATGLHAVDFFPRFFAGDKALITLLHIPLALHMVLNLRLMYPSLLGRVEKEMAFREQLAELKPWIPGDGPVLFSDANAGLRFKGEIHVESLIYSLLVSAKQIDPERLRADIENRKIAAFVLYTDVGKPIENDPEIPRLTEPQHQAIRDQYFLAKHLPGPYLGGLFIYKPKPHDSVVP